MVATKNYLWSGGLIRFIYCIMPRRGPFLAYGSIEELADAGISSVPVLSIRCFTDLNRKDTYDQQTNAREGARRIYRATPLGFIMAAKEKVSELFGELLEDD